MKIMEMQDTHGTDADFVVVTGDMLFNTKMWRSRQFVAEGAFQRDAWERWASTLKEFYPDAPIVAVPGNHDYCDYGIDGLVESIDIGVRTFIVDGVKFTGYRGVPLWRGYWNEEISRETDESFCRMLDPTADVLITHTPPFGIMGGVHQIHYGSEPLREWLEKPNSIKAHLYGHAHEGFGMANVDNRIYSNASTGCNVVMLDK